MTTDPTIIGIELGKNRFHLIGLDERGATILRRKLNRVQLAEYAATAPRCVVATESCPGSQYWGRIFARAGHEVRILPAQFVKPYLKAIQAAYCERSRHVVWRVFEASRQPRELDEAATKPRAALGGHPKPAIDRHLKTGHHA